MQRRSFCKLLASTTVSAGLPLRPGFGHAQGRGASGFGRYRQSYAEFCATPESQRVFYAVQGRAVVQQRLDNVGWRPTEMGQPPALPLPGGSHDGVPLKAPIPGLAGEGPYEPTWDSLQQYEYPEWYSDAKFGIWNHWSPQCVPEGTNVAADAH